MPRLKDRDLVVVKQNLPQLQLRSFLPAIGAHVIRIVIIHVICSFRLAVINIAQVFAVCVVQIDVVLLVGPFSAIDAGPASVEVGVGRYAVSRVVGIDTVIVPEILVLDNLEALARQAHVAKLDLGAEGNDVHDLHCEILFLKIRTVRVVGDVRDVEGANVRDHRQSLEEVVLFTIVSDERTHRSRFNIPSLGSPA